MIKVGDKLEYENHEFAVIDVIYGNDNIIKLERFDEDGEKYLRDMFLHEYYERLHEQQKQRADELKKRCLQLEALITETKYLIIDKLTTIRKEE